jgi:hypothetical protein
MKFAFTSLVGATAVASMLVAAGTASATDDTKCHAAIAKNITKYQATLAKNLVGCHKSRLGGKVGAATNCNTATGADIKGKRNATRDKVRGSIIKSCEGTKPGPAAIALYAACPSPVDNDDDGGATTGIDNATELANCLMDLSEHYINDTIGARLMGNPTLVDDALDAAAPTAADCQGAIGKALSKAVKAAGSNRAKCHASAEKGPDALVPYKGTTCATSDTTGKINPTFAALTAAINAECTVPADLPDLNNCTSNLQSPNAAALIQCGVTETAEPIANGLAGAALELTGIYSAVAQVTITAANGDVKIDSNTRLDSGWKGTAHQVDVIDQSLGAVNVTNCDEDNKNCDVTHNSSRNNCRCSNDPTVECTTMNAVGGVCGGANVCQCMFGPPLSISASATPVCVVNRFQDEFTGSTQELGEYNVGTSTSALVHLGISATKPCPTCDNDPNPNSNDNAGGVCDGGPRDGFACDQNADHPDFGPSSYDCPPSPGGNISGSGLLLALQFQSGTASLTAGIDDAGAFCDGTGDCHCSVCSGDSKIGCSTDATCAAAGAGTCGAALANNPEQNNCSNDVCTAEVDGTGTCNAGPILDYCGGFLNQFGNGVITCNDNTDCDSNDCTGDGMAIPGECGACGDVQAFTKCFPSNITASGTPGIFESTGASVFCSGQTGNSGVDNAGGLPGAGRVKLDFDFDLYCPNGTTRFQLPAGPNCP